MIITEETLIQHRIAIGDRLKTLRKQKQLTQDQVGSLTGLQKSHISGIEAGNWNYGINTLILLAIALELDIDLLLTPALSPDDIKGLKQTKQNYLDGKTTARNWDDISKGE